MKIELAPLDTCCYFGGQFSRRCVLIGSRSSRGSKYPKTIERRVVHAAEQALAQRQTVTFIDVLTGMRWLMPGLEDDWRKGRYSSLESAAQVGLDKIVPAMEAFVDWAEGKHLKAVEVSYISATRDRRNLRITEVGDEATEAIFRIQWRSPELGEKQDKQLREKQSKLPELVVISALNKWSCSACSGTGDLLIMEGPGPLCLTCAEMDHLVFLPAGNTALTRRAKAASGLSAVVVRFSRARKRYERQGLLVEERALADAEEQCLVDEEARGRRRERAVEKREEQDEDYHQELAHQSLQLFPSCPRDRAEAIARHAGRRGSGRVARSAAARQFDPDALSPAVAASIRHQNTKYDDLLMRGISREEARALVRDDVGQTMAAWRRPI